MLALPKKRPDFVEEDGGGGFWICEAVGARDWRIEYVRCMLGGGDGRVRDVLWVRFYM